MRVRVLACLSLVLVAPACRTHKPVPVDTAEAEELPREVILQKLGQLLPTADYVSCSYPKTGVKPAEIKAWNVRSDAIEIEFGKGKTLVLPYADVTDVRLELVGRYYTARVFTTVQTEKDKDHFEFQWKVEESAKRAVEMLAALKKK
jgi:hypothetical protein